MIIPSGLPDVEKFAKVRFAPPPRARRTVDAYPLCQQAENTKFFLTGVPNAERERVSFDLNQTCTWRAAILIFAPQLARFPI